MSFSTFGQRYYNNSMYNSCTLLQRMQQEFQVSLTEVASLVSKAESEPHTSTSTDPSGSSPPQVLRTHQQQDVDYMKLIMGAGEELTMDEDRAAPLITEVFSSMLILYTNL